MQKKYFVDPKVLQIIFNLNEDDSMLMFTDVLDKMGIRLKENLKKYLISKGFAIDNIERNIDSILDNNLVPNDWKMEETIASSECQLFMDEQVNNYFKVYYDAAYPKLDPAKQKELDNYFVQKQNEYVDTLMDTYSYYRELLKSSNEVTNDEVLRPMVNLGGQQANTPINR